MKDYKTEKYEMPETNGTVGPGQPANKRKFENLNEAAKGLGSVIEHLNQLHSLIGIGEKQCEPKCDKPKQPTPTLNSTLNELPGTIRRDLEAINALISDVESALD